MAGVSFCLLSRSRTARDRFWPLALLIVAVLLPLTGCGEVSHGNRVPLVGTVTTGGKPLDVNATISFDPVSGQDGVGTQAEVSQGKFSIPEESGPTPGRTFNVTLITAPGIPPDGTPLDQIKRPERFEKTVKIPTREEGIPELKIDFE